MSQGSNDNEKARDEFLSLLDDIICKATEQTKSIFSSACIYKVPQNLFELNHRAYTPQLITIGPFHRDGPYQHVKEHYANSLFLRLTKGIMDQENPNKRTEVLEECVKEMKMSADDVKKSYAKKDVDMDLMMMVIDGCFILELLYRHYDMMKKVENKRINGGDSGNSQDWSSTQQQPHEGEDTSERSRRTQVMRDPIFDSHLATNTVRQDLLLLENQIPFFLLEKLFSLTLDRIPNRPHAFSFTDYVSLYLGNTTSTEENSTNSGSVMSRSSSPGGDCVLELAVQGGNDASKYHILAKLHEHYRPGDQIEKKTLSKFMPSASELQDAGVKFVCGSGTGKDLFKVKFSDPKGLFSCCRRGCFEIPTLGINDPKERVLRNLIAFEQCCPGVSQHFTSYVFLMHMLVKSDKDVEVLQEAGVLRNDLGASDRATKLFNHLCKEVVLGDFLFADMCNNAMEYSERRWPKLWEKVRRRYFVSPFTFFALCGGVIVFLKSAYPFVIRLIYLVLHIFNPKAFQ